MLLSVIVPIYNADEYLPQCLDSIINQTYKNLEIILVDDGSTDQSFDICNTYAIKDQRIKVIHKDNDGLVNARKSGINYATGDYIGYVDADDFIEPDYFEKMIRVGEESKADIVAAGHYHDIGDDSSIIRNGICEGIYMTKDLFAKLLYNGKFFEYGITPQVYTKIFRADILKKAQLNVPANIVAGEDAAVTYPCICAGQVICITDIVGYHYVQHMGSMTKTPYSNEVQRVDTLISYLMQSFNKMGLISLFEKQIMVYRNYLLALRQIKEFDKDGSTILAPYGGLKEKDRVIIYGAGVLGQKIYSYLDSDQRVKIVSWLDKNYMIYRNDKLPVFNPKKIVALEGQYDYVIIANITETVATSIKRYLLDMGVDIDKIRWFSRDFRGLLPGGRTIGGYDEVGEII